jgi:hypothetical protein
VARLKFNAARIDEDAWRDMVFSWLNLCGQVDQSCDLIDCLRSALDCLEVAPKDVIALLGGRPDIAELELLLKLRAVESVASRLVANAPFGALISQAYNGPAACTVSMSGTSIEIHYSCPSVALVKLGAVLKAIATLMDDGRPSAMTAKIAAN